MFINSKMVIEIILFKDYKHIQSGCKFFSFKKEKKPVTMTSIKGYEIELRINVYKVNTSIKQNSREVN